MAEITTTSTWIVAGSAPAATVEDCFERYLLERSHELKPKSLRLYRFLLASFAEFLGTGTPAAAIDIEAVKAFLLHVYEHGYKPNTLIRFNIIVRMFCEWLFKEGLIDTDLASGIARPRSRRSMVTCLSDDHVYRLLSTCSDNWTGLRTRSILLTFLGSGLRVSELAALKLHDIDLGAGVMLVKGKGDKERLVPIRFPLRLVLEEWLTRRASFLNGGAHSALFVTKMKGRPTDHSIYCLVTRLAQRAGVTDVRCSPHTLRHTFATNYIREGGDVVCLQRILGHSNVNTTMVYVHLAMNDIKADFDRADPLRKFLDVGKPLQLFTS